MMNEFVSKKHDGRKVVLLLLAILSPFLATLIVHKFSLVSDLELLVYDWHCASLPRLKPDPRIVLIGMDDESLQAMNQPSYPLPRSLHGQLINELNSAGASSILFDIMFTNADTELEVEDRQFVAALRGRRNVIVSTQPKFRIDKEGHEQVTFALPDFRIRPFVLPAFIVVQKTFGNSVRSFKPSEVDADEGMRFNHLATMIAAAASHSLKSEPLVRNTFHMGSIDAPLGNDNEVMIRYIGPPETFQPIPYSRILQKKWTSYYGKDFFKGKVVLVGRISRLEDRQQTSVGDMQGCELILNAAQTLLQGNYVRRPSVLWNFVVSELLAVFCGIGIWKFGMRKGVFVVVGSGLAWALFAHQLFIRSFIWLDVIVPILVLGILTVLTLVLEAHFVKQTFHRFMPSWVADEMLDQSVAAAAGSSAEQDVTVVFCDVRGFTALSESLPSELVERIMQQYYESAEAEAHNQGTEIDKFVGDEIMLYFDDVERSRIRKKRDGEGHALRAVRWAIAMQKSADEIDKSGLTKQFGFKVGIGICTGPARMGLFGGKQRKQYTVYGDTVNTASRLQNVTKEVGKGIVMSESVYALVQYAIPSEPIGEVTVKGKQETIQIYCPVQRV